jgi:uncharacterized Tic20 family protein
MPHPASTAGTGTAATAGTGTVATAPVAPVKHVPPLPFGVYLGIGIVILFHSLFIWRGVVINNSPMYAEQKHKKNLGIAIICISVLVILLLLVSIYFGISNKSEGSQFMVAGGTLFGIFMILINAILGAASY